MTTAPINSLDHGIPRSSGSVLPMRMGGILALIAFACTLLAGLFEADNAFSTIVMRAIMAMASTLVVGYVVGWMAQLMLDENIRAEENKRNEEAKSSDSVESSATDGR